METPEERQARRDMKAARGDFDPTRAKVRMAALVRDKVTGRPKFDGDPRELPAEVRDAYSAHMTAAEILEFFG